MRYVTMVAATLVLGMALSAVSAAQTQPGAQPATQPATTQTSTAQLTAKIVAIDKDARVVTLQDSKGNTQSFKVGPEVQRFNELKAGDTVTFRYQASVAYAIVKPGTAAPAAASSPTITRDTGPNPGGTISQTRTANVTITAIDPTAPSVTVKTQDGNVVMLLVNDKANLTGLKVGDVVQVTYSEAVVIAVQSP
jgi:Cu/Ag efflux protein CusF